MGDTAKRRFVGTGGGNALYGAAGQRFTEPQGNYMFLPNGFFIAHHD